ncbi:unnamed protein product [Gongylonema pulchrum]|uniref:DDE_Tnp_1_7 domain-containing protein n=1 Tax=Gongylonema pulchrum TaxID=637853 RepID=A0A183D0B3_9BILA|nr:unnamed protein product [Gongylonema pulchrum]
MDVCRRLSHSSSASSVDTNHSSWSIIGDDGEDVDDYEFVSINDFYEDERDDYEFISNPQDLCEWRKMVCISFFFFTFFVTSLPPKSAKLEKFFCPKSRSFSVGFPILMRFLQLCNAENTY